MLEQNDIYIGRPLIYTLGEEKWYTTVTNKEEDGFWLFFSDGDTQFVWYEYDMVLVVPLEIT